MKTDTSRTIELVVFDMAGTTVYDGDAVHTQLAKALNIAGTNPSRDELNQVMGLPKPIAIRRILDRRTTAVPAATDEMIDTIYNDFQRFMIEYYTTSPIVHEIEGASATFQELQRAGIKIALDTGFNRVIVDRILDRLGWKDSGRIDASVASDEVANGRPYPDMIYRAMELTGVHDANRVAKVGDTPADLHEGAAADCGWVIGVTGGSHTAKQLSVYPHTHLIHSIVELPALFQ